MVAVNTSFFSEMLQSIADRSRAFLRERREPARERSDGLIELCEDLLSGRGEASGVALADEILGDYAALKTGPRIAFFESLATGVRSRFRAHRRRDRRLDAHAVGGDRGRAQSRQPSRAGWNCSGGLIWRPAAPRRWCACASNCSTPWIIATISPSSTTISSICSRRGSTAASWCCAASTGRRRR